jgi:hypothetical protein
VQPVLKSGFGLFVDHLIGYAEVLARFRMADYDIFYQIFEHRGGHLTGIGSLVFPVDILRADRNIRPLQRGFDAGQGDIGRADDLLCRLQSSTHSSWPGQTQRLPGVFCTSSSCRNDRNSQKSPV